MRSVLQERELQATHLLNCRYLSSPWCNPPVVWVSGVETSIKTWPLSRNLSLGLRRRQPWPECLFFLLPAPDRPWDFTHWKTGRNFSTWAKNQLVVRFRRLSVSDGYISGARQEIRLLNYRFLQGACHLDRLSYRRSIKDRHCNHLSLSWLNTFFQSTLKCCSVLPHGFCFLLQSSLSPSLRLAFPMISRLICACFGFKRKINSKEVSRGQWPDQNQSKVDYWLSCRQHGHHIGTSVT